MSFLRGLLAARSHLAFLVGIAAALLTIRVVTPLARPAGAPPYASGAAWTRQFPLRHSGSLTPAEAAMARVAWRYFRHNTDAKTGLTSSVKGYPSTTMWDLGSQLLATLAAEDLDLLTRRQASRSLATALRTLAGLDLCDGLLPNKAYDTRTLRMVGYDNVPVAGGVGWSAVDLGRLTLALSAVAQHHPELAPLVRSALARWHLDAAADGTGLVGATRQPGGALVRHQEGRFGYEQYAAKALIPLGVRVGLALDYRAHVVYRAVDGDVVPSDDRLPELYGGTPIPVLSEPWVLDGLEHGLDALTVSHARAVLAAQARRFAATGRITAVSEDHLDGPPWFAYSAVLEGRDTWTAVTSDGHAVPQALTFSTKAAIGWWALFAGDSTDRLFDAARGLVAPGEGLWAGRHDPTGEVNHVLSLNTNAVVLEALAFRSRGPLLGSGRSLPGAEARR